MTERINIHDLVHDDRKERSWLASAIMTLMSSKYKEVARDWTPGAEDNILEIELKFNGVDVSFTEYIEFLSKEFGRMVKLSAYDLFEKKVDKINNALSKIQEKVQETEFEVRHLLGVEDNDR